jgi:hypothetical protein
LVFHHVHFPVLRFAQSISGFIASVELHIRLLLAS